MHRSQICPSCQTGHPVQVDRACSTCFFSFMGVPYFWCFPAEFVWLWGAIFANGCRLPELSIPRRRRREGRGQGRPPFLVDKILTAMWHAVQDKSWNPLKQSTNGTRTNPNQPNQAHATTSQPFKSNHLPPQGLRWKPTDCRRPGIDLRLSWKDGNKIKADKEKTKAGCSRGGGGCLGAGNPRSDRDFGENLRSLDVTSGFPTY